MTEQDAQAERCIQAKRELFVDPKGEPAGSTRRRFAWAAQSIGATVMLASIFVPGLRDQAVFDVGIWAGVVLVLGGQLFYYLGRQQLEKMAAKLLENVARL